MNFREGRESEEVRVRNWKEREKESVGKRNGKRRQDMEVRSNEDKT